jgi:hypothetical protein
MGARGDDLGATLSARQKNGAGMAQVNGARTSPRVSGSTCVELKLSRGGSADGRSVKGFDVYAGTLRKESSRTFGCDSRKAAKSGSSRGGAQSASTDIFLDKEIKGKDTRLA